MRERARRATRSAVRRFRRAPTETVRYVRAVDGGRAFHRAPNDAAYGAVRFNLRGREPAGQVSPGREADALYRTLARELSTWTNLDTGAPLFTRIERLDDHYSGPERDRLPDLVVEYERGAPVRRVGSPEYGTIEGRYRGTRTGDHYPGGRVVAQGPGIAAGRALAPVALVDLAPTICAAAGVTLPAADGAVRSDLLPSSASGRR
jgi:predicted AlkP superfamily phosphohydrolase/phosphomutase